MKQPSSSRQDKHLFDNPSNVRRLLSIFYACCAVLLLLDFVITRHVSHPWESFLGFYPLFGFIGCVTLVMIAKWLRRFLKRDEGYYEPREQTQNSEKEGGHVGE